MDHGAPDEGEREPPSAFRDPLPPEDRLWRHPTEVKPPPLPTRSTASWGLAVASGLIGAVLTFGLVAATGGLDRSRSNPGVVREAVPVVAPTNLRIGDTEPVVRIAEEVSPAIVRIEVSGTRTGTGSGVVFRNDGFLLTNTHVVEGAESLRVILADGSEQEATLVGADRLTDVAVVHIDGPGPFPVAVLGSAASLRVGQAAVAIGSPLGLIGGSSVTTGVISALGRVVTTPSGPPLIDMIQTDAAIAPGSSGGALLDAGGSVIGITTAIAVSEAGAEGLGFATPIDIARSVAEDIIETGQAAHVWMGIEGRDLDATSAEVYGIAGGAVVANVVDDSPADQAGLAAEDIIVSIAGEPVGSMSALVIALRELDPGQAVELGVRRGNRTQSMVVELTSRPGNL